MRKASLIIIALLSFQTNAQQKDSLEIAFKEHLPAVVLTGQYNPQSVDKSIFEVEIISRSDIDKMAGNTLEDVLTHSASTLTQLKEIF